jgi:regulator of sigma E protease
MESLSYYLALIWYFIQVAIGIGFVIFVHELGHYLAAKACGVKVEKFLVGFDVPIKIGPFQLPRTLWRKQWGETFYAIGVIPLGGYVKMLGQDDNPANYQKEAERTKVRASDAEGSAENLGHHEDVIHGGMVAMGSQEDARGEHVEPLETVGNHGDESGYTIDPRSYTAKSVPQRMLIISAGVIMNVIFAVIMGAVAYGLGVQERPAVIAGTAPGSPAWTGNSNWGDEIVHFAPGDKIVQIGREGEPYDYLRFDKDLQIQVFLNGAEKDIELLVERDGVRQWVSVRPTAPDESDARPIPTIGVEPLVELKLFEKEAVVDYLPAGKAEPPFRGKDVIVAVNGEEVSKYWELQQALVRNQSKTLTFTVQREVENSDDEKERIEIRVEPNHMRTLGLAMRVGPLAAVQASSPADKAGIRAGDELVSLNGEAIGDPFTLDDRLQKHLGAPVELVVRRNGTDETLSVVPQAPVQNPGPYFEGYPVGLEEIGIAFPVLNEIVAVEPGGPAAAAGLEAGDRITNVEFVMPDKTASQERDAKETEAPEAIALGAENQDWPWVHTTLQSLEPGAKVKLTYERERKSSTATLEPTISEEYFNPERGIVLRNIRFEEHRASSFRDAVWLGGRESWERFSEVLIVLGKLLSGEISPTNLVGPAGIVYVAGAEASQGLGNLLIFLTFLSVNLAVINSLPIPVLDGGHFFFLIVEGIRGKPVSEKWIIPLTMAGLIFLLSLMLFVTTMDIGRFAGFVR